MHVLEHQLHILKDPRASWCHHVGTWSPQSPWRREHCSALGTWGAHPPLALPQPLPWLILVPSCHLHQPIGSPLLLPLHSQFLTPSSFGEPFPPLEQGSLQSQTPLAHSHYYRVIPLLGSPFFPHLSLSDCPQSRHILCIRFFHPLIHPLQIGLHLKPSLLHCLITLNHSPL
ncbi:unnamed protein product [Microthlaspi erraticum]|uniref:Uncharacterized protein n=1 Tax=Microthlaspi erraticum TaxID=1685480 RepID=A0A6D2LCH0_9BRAS|nr:unnamed protein product [Microthlaspi erraticum]